MTRKLEFVLLLIASLIIFKCSATNFNDISSKILNEKHWQYKEPRAIALLDEKYDPASLSTEIGVDCDELISALSNKPAKIVELLEKSKTRDDFIAKQLSIWKLRESDDGLKDWVNDISVNVKTLNFWTRPRKDILHVLTSNNDVDTFKSKKYNLYKPIRAAFTNDPVSPITLKTPSQAKNDALLGLGIVILGFFVAHLVIKYTFESANQIILPILLALTGIGANVFFLMAEPLFAVPRTVNFYDGVLVGLTGLVVIVLLCFFVHSGKIRYRNLITWNVLTSQRDLIRVLCAIATIGLALAFWKLGTGRGNLSIFGFQISSLINMFALLYLALYFAEYDEPLTTDKQFMIFGVPRELPIPRIRYALPLMAVIGAMLYVTMRGGDHGPLFVFCLTFIVLFSIASKRWLSLISGMSFIGLTYWFVYNFKPDSFSTAVGRWDMLKNPWEAGNGSFDHLAKSLWAFASGGLAGAGVTNAVPTEIPDVHNDFVLAGIGEAFGFSGVVLFLTLNAFLVIIMLNSALRSRDFPKYLLAGGATMIGIQTLVSACGVLGILPLTGIPMYFVSYGISATVVGFIIIALCLVATSACEEKPVRERKTTLYVAKSVFCLLMLVVCGRAFWIMVPMADEIAARHVLVKQREGIRRLQDNPRLLAIQRFLQKGAINDSHGNPLATNDDIQNRYYPLGSASYQVIEKLDSTISRSKRLKEHESIDHESRLAALALARQNDAEYNESYEKRLRDHLRGFEINDISHLVRQTHRDNDAEIEYYEIIRKGTLSELVPAMRDRGQYPDKGKLTELENKQKDVNVSLDARIQLIALNALENVFKPGVGKYRNKTTMERTSGAACIIDAKTGHILASVSLPTINPNLSEKKIFEEIDELELYRLIDISKIRQACIIRAAVNEKDSSGVDVAPLNYLEATETIRAAYSENEISRANIVSLNEKTKSVMLEKFNYPAEKNKIPNILNIGQRNFSEVVYIYLFDGKTAPNKIGHDKIIQSTIEKTITAKVGEILAALAKQNKNRVFESVFKDLPNEIKQHVRSAYMEAASLDRVSDNIYPPGSAFKLVTAASALENQDRELELKIRPFKVDGINGHVSGRNKVGNTSVVDNDKSATHGKLNIHNALVRSCNIFFAKLGHTLGAENLYNTAKKFGLLNWRQDIKTAADISNDRLVAISYGQEVDVSPLEMASVAAKIANPELKGPPILIPELQNNISGESAISITTARQLRRAMIDTVERPEGTGNNAKVPGLTVGGKTGTAEVTKSEEPHSWFVGFAYKGNDSRNGIAFAFVIENGNYGGNAAALAAKDFLNLYKFLGEVRGE